MHQNKKGGGMGKKKILLVDDEPDIMKTVQYMLEEEDYTVYGAQDGQECLKKVKKIKPDLILLDLILPDRSGFQIAQEIKSNKESSHISIIVLSCMTEESSRDIAAAKGAVEYMEKPIDIDKLLSRIKELLA